jgi:hypothetical protein
MTIVSAGYSPWQGSVTVGVTKVQLSTLIAALDANLPHRWTSVIIEFDIGGSGNVYISGPNVTPTFCGRHLIPSSYQNIAAYDTGVLLSDDIWLLSDTAAQQVNITAFPIGM